SCAAISCWHSCNAPHRRPIGTHVRLATSLRPLPLPEALAVAHSMAQRPDLEPSQRLAPDEWSSAAAAALLRRDRAGLEVLLQADLAPAVAWATALLGSAVAAAAWWPDEISEQWLIEMVARLDTTCLAVLHATEVVRVAERYEALVDPQRASPTRP